MLSDLEQVVVDDVFVGGRHVASGGQMLVPVVEGPCTQPFMRIGPVTSDDMVLRLPGTPDGTHRVRTIVGVPVTEWGEVEVEVTAEVAPVPAGHLLQC